MRLLTNPIVIRLAVMLFAMAFAFVLGVVAMRRMRRGFDVEGPMAADMPSIETLPMHMYNAVIQQLKQQKHELQSQQHEERRRAKTSENISAAVLSNLSCGVVFFTPDGLARQANTAAKRILGYASPLGVHAAQIFRDAAVIAAPGTPSGTLAEAVQSSLQEKNTFRRLEARYTTPGKIERTLEVTLTLVLAPQGESLGAACLINDLSEIAEIRQRQELQEEVSAEMALDLRTSLNTISGYAQRLVAGDAESARQLALDIAVEAAHLEHTVGGFLAGAKTSSHMAGV